MMRRYALVLVLGIFLGAGVAWAVQVNLLPNVQVDDTVRVKAVWGVCKSTGYAGDWGDSTAMWAWYRQELIRWVRQQYRAAKNAEAIATLPGEQTYEDEIVVP